MKHVTKVEVDLLNHLRWIAAIMVASSHVRSLYMVDYEVSSDHSAILDGFYFVTGFGHIAVVIFMVLSGFLVGSKLLSQGCNPRAGAIDKYIKDRFSRIFIVLFPSLALSAIVLILLTNLLASVPVITETGQWIVGWKEPLSHDHSIGMWMGNLLLINEFFVDSVYINGVIWSLSYEWYFYMISAVPLAFKSTSSKFWLCAFIVYVGGMTATAIFLKPEARQVYTYYMMWLGGLGARYIFNKRLVFGRVMRIAAILALCVALVGWRLNGFNDYVVVVALIFVLCNSDWPNIKIWSDTGSYLSKCSFSLYMTHAPMMVLFLAIQQAFGMVQSKASGFDAVAICCVITVLLVLVAKMFSRVTEDLTPRFRALLK